MYVIGTAGHVDHGKSTLVQALTGIDPDRLAEEKAREMTIDLGFAWLKLGPEQHEVGVVDVPGHRDFIENMLAGVGGIDLALFVVAADEGVMPQTREHLAILDLLAVKDGIVALTKADLIDDPEWLELVQLDLAEVLVGTVLENAPIVPVSAKSGVGIDQLRQLLWERLQQVPPREDKGRPRLPVDRVFSLSGFGTIVTGTLLDGRFHIGDQVIIQPSGLKARIRGLQSHKHKLEIARPGSRIAINLTGVDKSDVHRGQVICLPDQLHPTILFDAVYRHLPDASKPLKHNQEVKLFVGASEMIARTRIIGSKVIEPGQSGWLQLATREPVAVLRGDRFILRQVSPGATIGGGQVLDANPGRRHKRFRQEVVARLETLAQGTPEEMLLQTLSRIEPASRQVLLKQTGLAEDTAVTALQQLLANKSVIETGKTLTTRATWQKWQDALYTLVIEYNKANPLRLGISREEVRSRLKLPAALFNELVRDAVEAGRLAEAGTVLHKADHAITFSPTQQKAIGQLVNEMTQAGVNSPSVKDVKARIGEDVYFALVDLGELRPLSADVVYHQREYNTLTQKIIQYLQEHGTINAAQTRDLLGTSRKYAIALLEHLDDAQVTRRVGDNRELRQ
ncbi:MAG: selenocysteine-specific translation elongation factor [Candidatus Promineifilaceae bacterium]